MRKVLLVIIALVGFQVQAASAASFFATSFCIGPCPLPIDPLIEIFATPLGGDQYQVTSVSVVTGPATPLNVAAPGTSPLNFLGFRNDNILSLNGLGPAYDENGLGFAAPNAGDVFCGVGPSGPGCYLQNYVGDIEEINGSITTAALPAALPLLATGLGVIALFGWRRKQKPQAAA